MKKQIKKSIYVLLFLLSIVYCINAQEHCNGIFEAYSKKTGTYCKYCNESLTFIIPSKIKFNRTLVCESFQNPSNASSEGHCKFNAITFYLTFLYYNAWYKSNAFNLVKCYSINNPKDTHKAIERDAEDVGLKEYIYDDLEAKSDMAIIEETRSYIDYASFQQGRSVSAKYAIGVIQNSCN